MHEIKRFFQSRWVELLIAGIWLQSVVSAAFTGSLLLLAVTTLGGLVLLVVIFWLVALLRRRRPRYGAGEAFQIPRDGLIFTVGGQKDTLLLALQRQKPAWLGLICSRQTEELAAVVAEASGLEADCIQKESVDPWSVVEVRAKTAFLLDWLAQHRVELSRTAIDITGGTAIMSAGAFSVATERRVDCQYVRSDYDADNKPLPHTQRGVFVTRFE